MTCNGVDILFQTLVSHMPRPRFYDNQTNHLDRVLVVAHVRNRCRGYEKWLESGKRLGNVESLLTPSQRNELEELTPFTDREIMRLLHVYTMYDRSEKGDSGITWKTCKMIPQLTNNRLIVQAVEYYLHQTHNLYPREFVLLCGILSSQTTAENKKEFIFRMLDTHCSGVLKHEALFGFYKSLLGGAISDDQILNLISNALQSSPDNPGMITKAQFMKMIPNEEMLRKFTVDFLTNQP